MSYLVLSKLERHAAGRRKDPMMDVHLFGGASGMNPDPHSSMTGWWLSHPSEKYEFVSWDDDIPN